MSDTSNPISHVFDQTNGVVDGLEGESDGTAGTEVRSAADLGVEDRSEADVDDPTVVPSSASGGDDREVEAGRSGTASPDQDLRGGSPQDHPAHRADRPAAVAADRFEASRDGGADDADLSESSATTSAASTAAAGSGSGLDDDSIGHVFDQTNGVVEGLEGESDGTAEGDEASTADRGGLNEPNPVGQQDAFHDDHYGADDGTDRDR